MYPTHKTIITIICISQAIGLVGSQHAVESTVGEELCWGRRGEAGTRCVVSGELPQRASRCLLSVEYLSLGEIEP